MNNIFDNNNIDSIENLKNNITNEEYNSISVSSKNNSSKINSDKTVFTQVSVSSLKNNNDNDNDNANNIIKMIEFKINLNKIFIFHY